MAGDEHQPQHVVAAGRRPVVRVEVASGSCVLLAREASGAADVVDRAALGDRGQPGAGVVRYAGRRPLFQGRDQRVLGQFLGQADVAHHPQEPGDDARGLLLPDGGDRARDTARSVDAGQCRGSSGRRPRETSLSPSPTILRKRRPSSIASSLERTSTSANPPTASLASVNGPSVTVISSPCEVSLKPVPSRPPVGEQRRPPRSSPR